MTWRHVLNFDPHTIDRNGPDMQNQMTLDIIVKFDDAETEATWVDDRIGWQFVLDL